MIYFGQMMTRTRVMFLKLVIDKRSTTSMHRRDRVSVNEVNVVNALVEEPLWWGFSQKRLNTSFLTK